MYATEPITPPRAARLLTEFHAAITGSETINSELADDLTRALAGALFHPNSSVVTPSPEVTPPPDRRG